MIGGRSTAGSVTSVLTDVWRSLDHGATWVWLTAVPNVAGSALSLSGVLNVTGTQTLVLAAGHHNSTHFHNRVWVLSIAVPTVTAVTHQLCSPSAGVNVVDCPLSGGGVLTITGAGFSASSWLPLQANSVCSTAPIRTLGFEDTQCTCVLSSTQSAGSTIAVQVLSAGGVSATVAGSASVTVSYVMMTTLISQHLFPARPGALKCLMLAVEIYVVQLCFSLGDNFTIQMIWMK